MFLVCLFRIVSKGALGLVLHDHVNLVWMISGFSCQSSMLTHI